MERRVQQAKQEAADAELSCHDGNTTAARLKLPSLREMLVRQKGSIKEMSVVEDGLDDHVVISSQMSPQMPCQEGDSFSVISKGNAGEEARPTGLGESYSVPGCKRYYKTSR
ncbi:hypothetical protein S7711_10942 [Stachybotrys chartarum IBT 7711]|uniref:Uncharacterized protein n=1 Tax=Stachybotrys chartarum (strain CBS 109288 / IBT 7711) TaxID=1280523 RepID=A0A084AHE6_STACB|nr:hypothetical protein S7711_10942 [Stachybotrys chartarum IBT 7711]